MVIEYTVLTPCRQLVGVALLTTIIIVMLKLFTVDHDFGGHKYTFIPCKFLEAIYQSFTSEAGGYFSMVSVQFLAREKTHSAGIINSADNKQKI